MRLTPKSMAPVPPSNITLNVTTAPWQHPREPASIVALSVSLGVILLLSLLGNGLVILVILKHRGMRTRTNFFIFNLAVADILTGILLIPFAIVTVVKGRWIFGPQFCQFQGFIMPLFFVTSIHTLMYMALHKYLTIIHPFDHYMTKKKIVLMISAAWFWAAVMGYLTIYGLNSVEYKPNTLQCGPLYPSTLVQYIHAFLVIFSCYVIPLIVMMFCYFRMFREIRGYTERIVENACLEEDVVFRQQRRITVTLFLVLVAFVLCWTPYIVYCIYSSVMKDKNDLPRYINEVSYWFGYFNSAVNPIIYALRSQAFRDGYKTVFYWHQTPRIKDDSGASQTSRFTRIHVQHLKDIIHRRLSTLLTGNSGATSGAGSFDSLAAPELLAREERRRRGHSISSLPGNFKFDTMAKNGLIEAVLRKGLLKKEAEHPIKKAKIAKSDLDSWANGNEKLQNAAANNNMIDGGNALNGNVLSALGRPTNRPSPKLKDEIIHSIEEPINPSKRVPLAQMRRAFFADLHNSAAKSIQIVISDADHNSKEYNQAILIHYQPDSVPDAHIHLETVPQSSWTKFEWAVSNDSKNFDSEQIYGGLHGSTGNLLDKGKIDQTPLKRSVSAKPRRRRLPSIEKLDVSNEFRKRSSTYGSLVGTNKRPKKDKRDRKRLPSLRRSKKKKNQQCKQENPGKIECSDHDDVLVADHHLELSHIFRACSDPEISLDHLLTTHAERQQAKREYHRSLRKRRNYSSATEEPESCEEVRRLSHCVTDSALLSPVHAAAVIPQHQSAETSSGQHSVQAQLER